MDGLIRFFVFMTLLFATLGQTKSIPPKAGYGVAIGTAIVAAVLAIVRYRKQTRP